MDENNEVVQSFNCAFVVRIIILQYQMNGSTVQLRGKSAFELYHLKN